MFPKIGVPQNGWFISENPIRMHDLVVPLFLETSIYFANRNFRKAFVLHSMAEGSTTQKAASMGVNNQQHQYMLLHYD